MPRDAGERYRFGAFELRPALRELRHDGAPVHLQPKPFDLLVYLLRHRDRVVSRDELLDAVWPGVAVSAEALAFAMHSTRRAVGDDGTRQQTIVTIPRCGFRFVAPVEEDFDEGAPAAGAAAPGGRDRSRRTPFVGRRELLDEFRALVAAATERRGWTFLVSGEAGIGKTRAVEELTRIANESGCRVLTGRCSEAEGSPAFWPWVQIVRCFTQGETQQPLLRILGDGAPEIARMVPELREQIPNLGAAADVESRAARFLLFDSMAIFIRRACELQPIVVVLDDLHRADQPSLLLFEFIARELRGAGLLLVGTYREAEMRIDPAQLAPISSVAREEHSRTFGLEGLSRSEVGELIGALSARSPSAEVTAHLHEQSDGNPFFLNQILQVLEGEGRIAEVESPNPLELVLPRRVQDAITRQTDALPPDSRELLQMAAVIGRDFALDALRRVAKASREHALHLLEPALEAGIVAECEQAGEYRFSHALVRDALHQTLSPKRRAKLHGRAGRALEDLWGNGCGPQSASLAHHYSQAVAAGDGAQALRHSILAGEWASERLAFEEALPQYERALHLLDLVAPADEMRRCELLLAYGDAHTRAGNRETAREVLSDAARLAKRAGLPEKLATAALRFAPDFLAIETGVYDSALVDLLEDALAAMDESDSTLRARLLARLAVGLHWSEEACDRRRIVGAQAIEMADRLEVPGTTAYVRTARMLAEYSVERPEKYLDADTGGGLAPGDEPIALLRQLLRITSLLLLGRVFEVDAAIQDFAALAEKLRQPQSLWYVDLFRATRAQMEGRFEEAKLLRGRFLTTGMRVNDQNAIQSSVAQGIVTSMDVGGLESFLSPIRQMVERFPRIPGWRAVLSMAHAELGMVRAASEDLDWLTNSHALRHKRNDWSGAASGMAISASIAMHKPAAHVLYEDLSRSPCLLTRSELEIPSWLWPQAAWSISMPRFSARFSAGVIQSSAS